MAGCCGQKAGPGMEYEVTFRDGSTRRVPTAGEARIVARMDTTQGNKAPTIRPVAKIAKTP